MKTSWWLMGFLKKHRAFIVYNIFGFMATLLNASLYALFYNRAGLSNVLSTFASLILTIVFAFFTNKLWVYKSGDWSMHNVMLEFSSFFGARAISSVFDLVFMYVTVDIMSLHPVSMKLISALAVGLINYFFGKSIFYRSRKAK